MTVWYGMMVRPGGKYLNLYNMSSSTRKKPACIEGCVNFQIYPLYRVLKYYLLLNNPILSFEFHYKVPIPNEDRVK